MTEATETEVRTCCRCCPAGCGILVAVDHDRGGRVTGVRGDRDHPISHGYTCAKARALPDFHHHPERLDRPASFGVGEGDAVEVRSASGRVTATVRLDGGLRPGTVSVPHGWHGPNVCRLTSTADVDPLTTQPQMSGYPVSLHPAGDLP